MGIKKQYVVPTNSREVCLLDYELKLAGYAIGRDMIVDEVLKEWMFNSKDSHHHTGLMNYVTEVVNQEYSENMLIDETPSGMRAYHSYQNTIDEMTDCCIEVTTMMFKQLEPYLDEIEDHMVALGAKRHNLDFKVVRALGEDVLIEVTDDDESEQTDEKEDHSISNN